MVICGMMLNRIDVGGLAMLGTTGGSYTPLWTEIVISLGIVSVATLVFLFAIEHFSVWDIIPREPESLPYTPPSFDYSSRTWLGTPDVSGITKHSLAFVLSFAVGMALMPGMHLHSKGIDIVKVHRASGIDTLYINGNRDDQFVEFTHQAHIEWIKKHRDSLSLAVNVSAVGFKNNNDCIVCHHLNLPGEKLSECWECHTRMYTETDFFKHVWHSSANGANLKCNDCHTPGKSRSAQTAKKCTSCHPTYKFTVNAQSSGAGYYALSYTDAMHNLCVSCHAQEAKILKDKPNLALCSTCHKSKLPENLTAGLNWKITIPHFNNVILPDVKADSMLNNK